ncbi:flagellar protein FlaG [Pseudoalteromonas sp. 2CM28B]|uniref:flagellar protein FlaG n=1 Tax=Pseudoalteromonas sp. 2CM28B TaxID=2929851 RepID=UPI0020BDB263|nr:flagellar protein FlaG [Pseudoalteromonas sp. 2CM28B]MCK8135308.1 flagellar protein FlaG [Pseudoalteromonas sp. 2CM28B]
MNMITSQAGGQLTTSNAVQVDKQQAEQAAEVLTSLAVKNVTPATIQAQQNLARTIEQGNNNETNTTAPAIEREQLEKVAQQLQGFLGEMNRSLQFQVDEDSGRDVIKVLDKATGDVIKQYPSEEVLSLVSKLSETAGLLIDQTA